MSRRLPMIASMLGLTLLGLSAAPAFAQEELPAGVTLEVMANGVAAAVPEVASQMILLRMVLTPGTVYALDPDLVVVALAEIERGELTVEVDGALDVARAAAEPGATEEFAAGTAVTLTAGDSMVLPAGLKGEVRNEGEKDAALLIIEAVRAIGEDESMPALPAGATVELLAAGERPPLGEGGAFLWLGTFALAPGAAFPGESQPGAELAVGQAGTFTMTPTAGPGMLVLRQFAAALTAGEAPAMEEGATGDTLTFAAGDAVYFPDGNTIDMSNEEDEPAVALFGGIGPVPGE